MDSPIRHSSETSPSADSQVADGRSGDAGAGNIILFVPDITDVSTIKRAESFIEYGYRLLIFGFRRKRYNRTFKPDWPCVLLGQTMDGRYVQRLWALIRALPVLVAHRRHLRGASIFYARNIDQLMLALVANLLVSGHRRIVYEVLDVQPIFTGDGFASRLLRLVERFGLRRVELLVLSSPGFLRNYFHPTQHYSRPWFLLENKLSADFWDQRQRLRSNDNQLRTARNHQRQDYRWVVGYCGLIRGQETFDLIVRLAEQLQGLVLFKFRGILTTVDRRGFDAAVARLDNLVFEGDYVSPHDLGTVYGDLDFAWALDLENTEHNSRWLLPCRFYEAGYFGVPCLAAKGFEVGTMVDTAGIGWSFAENYEQHLLFFSAALRGQPMRHDASACWKCRRPGLLPAKTLSVSAGFWKGKFSGGAEQNRCGPNGRLRGQRRYPSLRNGTSR